MSEDSDLADSTKPGPAAPDPRQPTPSLEYVVDDLGPREACADWILEQMTAGHSAEELTAELIAQGWDEDDAESLVEYVRRATRRSAA